MGVSTRRRSMSLAFLKSPAPESSGPILDTQKPSRPYESLPSQGKLLTFSSRADPPAELISCTFQQPQPQQPLAQSWIQTQAPQPCTALAMASRRPAFSHTGPSSGKPQGLCVPLKLLFLLEMSLVQARRDPRQW